MFSDIAESELRSVDRCRLYGEREKTTLYNKYKNKYQALKLFLYFHSNFRISNFI